MARPTFIATDEKRGQVKAMAALGTRQEDIAKLLGMTPKTLRKHFRSELDLGAIEANAKVLESLFQMATSGKNTAATIFWVKTRCGAREQERRESSREAAPAPFVVEVE
ncbi:MAG TPA: hypothetical protein VFB14_10805 [Bryobacteraceae bacterium]|jgi:predicted transcriptional regulator|nr:hypothetical protein [Bryobacteraceae bacterium]